MRRIADTLFLLTIALALHGRSAVAGSPDWQAVSVENPSAMAGAVALGVEDRLTLYACRGVVGSGVHLGRFRSDFAGCHIGYGGQELSIVPFEVLTTAWQRGADGVVPPHSLGAGERVQPGLQGQFDSVALHPCRTRYRNSLQLGEVAQGDAGCSFGFGGRQVTESSYEVLWRAPWLTWTAGIAQQIPVGAVNGGTEGGEPFYVCRAADATGLHPGKIKSNSKGCSIASHGSELVSEQFSILVPRWMPGNAGTIPIVALPAGRDKDGLLFLCRATIRNTVQIGRTADPLAACRVGMMGGEIASQSYDVLSQR